MIPASSDVFVAVISVDRKPDELIILLGFASLRPGSTELLASPRARLQSSAAQPGPRRLLIFGA